MYDNILLLSYFLHPADSEDTEINSTILTKSSVSGAKQTGFDT